MLKACKAMVHDMRVAQRCSLGEGHSGVHQGFATKAKGPEVAMWCNRGIFWGSLRRLCQYCGQGCTGSLVVEDEPFCSDCYPHARRIAATAGTVFPQLKDE